MTPYDNEIDQLLTQAEALLQAQNPTEALDLLERARTLEPAHAWTQLFRGVALGQLGRLEEAIDQLITTADGHTDDIDIQVDAARHLSLLEQYQDALICAVRAIALDDTDAGAHAIHGEALERLGRIEQAVESRERALDLDADDFDSRYYLAVDYCDLGRYKNAFDTATPLFSQFPDDPDIIRLEGACLSYLGRHDEALGKWAEVERLEGMTANLLHNRASTLDALGYTEEALETIGEAIALEPELAMNYYTRAMMHEHVGDDAAAIEDYLAALMCDSSHLDSAINLIELAVAVQAAPFVLDRIDLLLQGDPQAAHLLYTRGRLAMELNDYEGAEQALEEALRREPTMNVGWYALSMLYSLMDKQEEALRATERALQAFPDDPVLWITHGQVLHDLQRLPEAMASFDRAAEMNPEDCQPWLQMGRLLLFDLNRPADAAGALNQALRLQPDNDIAPWMLALCYLRLEKAEKAMQEIRRLLHRSPSNPWGRMMRAACNTQQGFLDEAITDLEAVFASGYDPHVLLHEPLFAPLYADPRFQAILRNPRRARQDTRK